MAAREKFIAGFTAISYSPLLRTFLSQSVLVKKSKITSVDHDKSRVYRIRLQESNILLSFSFFRSYIKIIKILNFHCLDIFFLNLNRQLNLIVSMCLIKE